MQGGAPFGRGSPSLRFYRHLRQSDNTRPSESQRLPSELAAAAAHTAASAAMGATSELLVGVMITSRTASALSHAAHEPAPCSPRKMESSEKQPKATGPITSSAAAS